eukprot:PITA_11584
MGRSPCCSKEGLNRGAWTSKEDVILSEYIRIHGDGGWRNLPKKAGLMRCGKSCRLRWLNYLRPDIKRGNISPDEEDLIIRLHRLLGNRWSLIAGRLPGRTDNEIKNYWNSHLNKKMLSVTQSHHNSRKNENAKTVSKSRRPKSTVFKTIPTRIKPVVRKPEIERLKGSYGHNSSYLSPDRALKSCNAIKTMNSTKSCCDRLVNDFIIVDDSDNIVFAAADKLAETNARTCTFSLSSIASERSPHSDYFAGLPDNLFSLNGLSSPDCIVLSCLSDSVSEEFCREPATLEVGTKEFEVVYFDQSSMQDVNSFTDAADEGREYLFNNTLQVDWIHELHLQKGSPPLLGLLLSESEEEWKG